MPARPALGFARRHRVGLGVLAVLVVFLIVFDWNWLRGPVSSFISSKTDRPFRMSRLEVDLGLTSTITLHDLYFGNAPWGRDAPMAQMPRFEFSVYLPSLFADKIQIPRMALTRPEVVMELAKDGQRNWRIAEPGTTGPGRAQIGTLSVDQGRLAYYHHGKGLTVMVEAQVQDAAAAQAATQADAAPQNRELNTEYKIGGAYQGADFSGTVWAGNTLSFKGSNVVFPLKGHMQAGTTRVEVEGTIADLAELSGIDTHLKIEGRTLANLYPFLLLPMPASPPYALEGRLRREGDQYSLKAIEGKIGETDIAGEGAYVMREPRPLLTASLRSQTLDLADLGPLVGARDRETGAKPRIGQAGTRNQAAAEKRAAGTGKVLPQGKFESARFRAIDAEVDWKASRLKAPTRLPFESFDASLRLHDGVMKLAPLDFGFAGGTIALQVTVDGTQDVLDGRASAEFRRIGLERLLPKSDKLAKSTGRLGGRIDLHGKGNSVAELMASADGSASAAVSGGRISNLVDAASGLNGGKVLSLLAGGDEQIAIRCGAAKFDIKQGKATSSLILFDTEETQMLGEGSFDLGRETLDFRFVAEPKKAGILSMRTPINLSGTWTNTQIELEKGPMAARAAGALALALVATPLAALLPLVETGSGEDADCGQVLGQVPAGVKPAKTGSGR